MALPNEPDSPPVVVPTHMPAQFPWPVRELRNVNDLRVGDRVACALERSPRVARCSNCEDHQTVYVYRIVAGGTKVHFFDDGRNFRMLQAELESAPCPVCQRSSAPKTAPPSREAPADDDLDHLI